MKVIESLIFPLLSNERSGIVDKFRYTKKQNKRELRHEAHLSSVFFTFELDDLFFQDIKECLLLNVDSTFVTF